MDTGGGDTANGTAGVECKTQKTKNIRKAANAEDGKYWMFNDIRVFTALLFTIVTVYTMMSAFTIAILVTLERRYGLTVKQQGYLSSSSSIATMCTVPFVGHLLGRPSNHRPRWLGMGVILIGASFTLGSLPHFLSAPYQYDRAGNLSSGGSRSDFGLCEASFSPGDDEECQAEQIVMSEDNKMAFAIFFISQLCTGIGYSFIVSLGFSFIDDFSGQRSSLFLGIIDGAWGVGLPIGFGILSYIFLAIYVDFNRVDIVDINIDDSDPRWIGAWWVVGIACGPLLILLSLPLFFFPRHLPLEKTTEDKIEVEKSDEIVGSQPEHPKGKLFLLHVKELLLAIWTMLRNPVFMLVCMAYSINSPMAFGLFMPKYFQKDLGFTLGMSNLITGFLWLFPNLPTAVFIGWLMKRRRFTMTGIVKLIVALVVTIIITNSLVIGLPCEGPYLEGTRSDEKMVVGCNSECNCNLDHYQPVCGSNGLNYYSPCYAGCSTVITDKNFTDCLCINSTSPTDAFARDGLCPIPLCKYFIPFLLILTVFSFCNSGMSLPVTMVTIRCVDKKQKSLALALKYVIYTLLRLPGTIGAGALIDYTCLLWREECNERGACAQYDNAKYRVLMLSMSACMSTLALVLLSVTLFTLIRRQGRADEASKYSKSDAQSGMNDAVQLKRIENIQHDNQGFQPT